MTELTLLLGTRVSECMNSRGPIDATTEDTGLCKACRQIPNLLLG